MRDCIAIIPARGGSKRIPKKNIRPFLGQPILAYAIKAAKECGCFTEVMVSTDCQEIAEVALAAGANVPFHRSSGSSGDFSTTVDVIREVIGRYEAIGRSFPRACCIYPANPFLKPERIREAAALLESHPEVETVLAVVQYSHPIQRAFHLEEGRLAPLDKESLETRTQDLLPCYHDAGSFYFFRTEQMLAKGALITSTSAGVVLPHSETHDIDTPEDWDEAELKYRILHRKTAE